jgi:hypothetical protein
LGLTYYSLGRTPEAIREWEAVREHDPNRHEALMYLRLVRGLDPAPEPAANQGGDWSTRPLVAASNATPEGPLGGVADREPSLEAAPNSAFMNPHAEAED